MQPRTFTCDYCIKKQATPPLTTSLISPVLEGVWQSFNLTLLPWKTWKFHLELETHHLEQEYMALRLHHLHPEPPLLQRYIVQLSRLPPPSGEAGGDGRVVTVGGW